MHCEVLCIVTRKNLFHYSNSVFFFLFIFFFFCSDCDVMDYIFLVACYDKFPCHEKKLKFPFFRFCKQKCFCTI
jgi:hypothetical protein